MKYLALILFLNGCSFMYVDYAIIEERDIQSIRDESLNIRAVQQQTAGRSSDLGRGLLFSSFSGMGMGFYEGRILYAGKAFPGERGPLIDWYRSDHRGSEMFKPLDSDKLSRTLWQSCITPANNAWIRFWGGNWVLAVLSHWIVQNSVATVIRSHAKYGELRVDVGIDLPFLE